MRNLKMCLAIILILFTVNCIHVGAKSPITTVKPGVSEFTSEAYMFSLNGNVNKFILLDMDDSGFFVTTEKFYGCRKWDITKYESNEDTKSSYDDTDVNNMAYWLNNEFLESGNSYNNETYKLPDAIIKHMQNRKWDVDEDETIKIVESKVSLLSLDEWDKYRNIMGYADDTSATYYYLRSMEKGAPIVALTSASKTGGGKTYRDNYAVRPVFWIDKDFFNNEKINLTNTGVNVKYALRTQYQKSDLSDIYTAEELEEIFDEELPLQATLVYIKGVPQVGRTMTAYYSVVSYNSAQEDGNTKYAWLRSKTKNGSYTEIEGADSIYYTPTSQDAGYYVKFRVTPDTYKLAGISATSDVYYCIEGDIPPVAFDLDIIGEPAKGEILVADYHYEDANDDIEEGTVVTWQRTSNGIDFENIAHGVTYKVTKCDIGKQLRYVVTPKNVCGTGKNVASEITKIVYAKPVVSNCVITENDGYISVDYDYTSFVNTSEGESEIWWEISALKDGQYRKIEHSLQKNELEVQSYMKGLYVRCVVTPKDTSQHIGDRIYSESIQISGEAIIEDVTQSELLDISGEYTAFAATGAMPPYMISFIVEGEGVSVISDKYKVTTVTKNGYYICVLTKTGKISPSQSQNLFVINAESTTTLKNIKTGYFDSNNRANVVVNNSVVITKGEI